MARVTGFWHGPAAMRTSLFASTRAFTIVTAMLSGTAISCAGTPLPEAAPPEIPRPPPSASAPAAPAGPALLPSVTLAMIEDENASPHFARRGEAGLFVYASRGRWLSRAVGADGAPKAGEPREVATVAAEPRLASVKPVGEGYLVVWAEPVAKNHAIKVLALDTEGKALGAPQLVTQVTDEVSWVDVLPNKKGALVVWEVPAGERSDVYMAALNATGKPESAAVPVAQGVIGWEAEATARGAAVVTVASDAGGAPAKKAKKPAKTAEEARPRAGKLGRVMLIEVDDRAKVAAPVVVSAEPTAQVDASLAEVGGKYLVSWTDERNIDACVYLATVDPGGKVAVAPHRATAPFGEQALVSLVAEGYAPGAPQNKRALLAWEDQIRAPREGRLIHLGTVGADGALGKERARLVFSAEGPPDIVADGDGFAALTLAPVREAPPGVDLQLGPKGDAPVWPAFVRLGADLSVLASEPVRAEPFKDNERVPYLTRALSCAAGKCTTLASGSAVPQKGPEAPAVPAPMALVSLPKRESPWRPVAAREADEAPPRAASVTALFSDDNDHLAKVAGAELPGGASMAAWITYVIPSLGNPRGKRGKDKAPPAEDAPGATLGIRAIGEGGAPGKAVTISNKAVSIGGVALSAAPGEGKKAELALGWIARVRGEPQVFVTKLGPTGDKLAEKGVTVISRKGKKKGQLASECSDVALTYAGGEAAGGDGWLTAWVDTRDGNAEVYAAKVDRSLAKVVPDKRLTDAPGDAADVQIAVRGKDALLVWSDARAKPEEGNGDIYVARLDAATLKKAGPETRLFASSSHSRSPQVLVTAKGYLVTWIEEGEGGKSGDEGAGLRVAELDDKGNIVGAPQLVRGADGAGTVTSAALACGARSCRGALTSRVGESLLLGAFDLTPGAAAGPVKTIGALAGRADISLAFAGQNAASLFFADDAVNGAGRVRWMQITWP